MTMEESSSSRPTLPLRQFSDSFDGCTGSESPDVRTLSVLLAPVFNWENLGVKLGLDVCKVEEIKQRHNGNLEMCKNSVYDAWLRLHVDPSWSDVVNALEQMEENNLANKIRQRYSTYFTECEDTPKPSAPIQKVTSLRSSSIDSEVPEVVQLVIPVSLVPSVQPTFATSLTATSSLPSSATPHLSMTNVLSSSTFSAGNSGISLQDRVSVTSAVSASTPPLISSVQASAMQSEEGTSEALAALLKSMTIEDTQQIEIDCKVYNASTNQLIESTRAPLTRDIKIVRHQKRVQEFSSDIVPIGTDIRIEVTSNTECYLYILNIGTSGKTGLLLPNEYDSSNYLRSSETYHLPGPDFGFTIDGPPGKETIQIFAFSEKQTKLEEIAEKPKQLYRDILCRRKTPTTTAIRKGFAQIQFDVQ